MKLNLIYLVVLTKISSIFEMFLSWKRKTKVDFQDPVPELLCYFQSLSVFSEESLWITHLGQVLGARRFWPCLVQICQSYVFVFWLVSPSLLPLWAEAGVCNRQDASLPWTWRGAGISCDEVLREGQREGPRSQGSEGTLSSQEDRADLWPWWHSVGFGGNKGQRQAWGGPRSQRREEYVFKLRVFLWMGRKGQFIPNTELLKGVLIHTDQKVLTG